MHLYICQREAKITGPWTRRDDDSLRGGSPTTMVPRRPTQSSSERQLERRRRVTRCLMCLQPHGVATGSVAEKRLRSAAILCKLQHLSLEPFVTISKLLSTIVGLLLFLDLKESMPSLLNIVEMRIQRVHSRNVIQQAQGT